MGSRVRIFKFWDLFRKFGTGVARIFKFGTLTYLYIKFEVRISLSVRKTLRIYCVSINRPGDLDI